MFFRTVSVAVLVALAIAKTTVRGSEVAAPQDVFNNMTQTWDAIQINYEAFSANVDIDHATVSRAHPCSIFYLKVLFRL